MLDNVEESLAKSASTTESNKYCSHFHSQAVMNTLDLLKKTFLIYAPKAEQCLEETLIMSTQDFKLNFMNSVWKEMEKVCLSFNLNTSASLKECVVSTTNCLAESKINIKDMFRFFKDIYPIVISDTINKEDYTSLHEAYKLILGELDQLE